ncbi:sulfatase-like hydrolase/transferase [Polaribacter sp. Z022]|uniref:sulfatase-like hydrolase/transferase n=1 Tax=Polaribacter sp. Z022 TaxID=2927125 RepID=UPI0020217ADC|nr:sulfatase-like hydrolase/transferase [Polaribacter sp. Z022]MCL7752629.1 sulfatase-like hydrolase/transferase [Polaribacter sp. Z022]
MKQINLLKAFLLLVFVGLVLGCTSTKDKTAVKNPKKEHKNIITPSKPNILVILCDDLGYSDVGFNGSKDIPTPALDGLAKDGTIFTSAYVTHPFCGPSRAGLMTGVYPHRIGAQFNLPPNSGETIKKGISLKETFISKVLDKEGYNTGLIGKWHLGSNAEFHPNVRGFDDFYGFLGGGHNYFPEQYRAAYKRQSESGRKIIWDYLHPLEHNGKQIKETEYLTDAFSREAVRFITDAGKTKDPFFLYLSYNAPHTPLEAKEEDLKLFSHIKDKKRRTYAAMVYAVDRGVKKIKQSLIDSGQLDNTLIVFFSDNGGKTKAGATNYPLKDGKGSAYEGGYRVPMFFHWPKVVPAGEKFDFPVSALDFYPTFAKLAGAKIPATKKLDGKDIWNNFITKTDSYKDDNIFVLRHRNGFSDVGVRKNEWKAVKAYNQKWKLFNIENDMAESNDVSSKYPEILKDLVKDAAEWSVTHKQPEWWHNVKTGKEWKALEMPKFDKTFKIE